MPSIFISCVSAEFRSYRDALRQRLTAPGRHIKVQEDFVAGGGTLLEKLADYIESCQGVIHLVGEGCGARPTPREVRVLLAARPSFATEFPEFAAALAPEACPFTYTQWEAFLALYYRVPCYIYLADASSLRESDWRADDVTSASQSEHIRRLKELGQDRRMLPFKDERDVALSFLNSITSLSGLDLPPLTTISWPTMPQGHQYPLADREVEFETFLRVLSSGSRERIYFISGPSDRGKSVLLAEFCRLGWEIPGIRCGRVEFKTAIPLNEALWDLARDLHPLRFPRFDREHERSAVNTMRTAFIDDLEEAGEPVLLVLDTYEQATNETREWVERRLLPAVARRDALRLVLAGKEVPDMFPGAAWTTRALRHDLPPITDEHHWCEYSQRVVGLTGYRTDQIATLVRAAYGSPRAVSAFLGNLKAQSA